MCLPLELYPEQWQEGDEVVLAPGIDARRDLLKHQLCTVTRVYNHAARLIRLTRKSDGKDLGNFETPELARPAGGGKWDAAKRPLGLDSTVASLRLTAAQVLVLGFAAGALLHSLAPRFCALLVVLGVSLALDETWRQGRRGGKKRGRKVHLSVRDEDGNETFFITWGNRPLKRLMDTYSKRQQKRRNPMQKDLVRFVFDGPAGMSWTVQGQHTPDMLGMARHGAVIRVEGGDKSPSYSPTSPSYSPTSPTKIPPSLPFSYEEWLATQLDESTQQGVDTPTSPSYTPCPLNCCSGSGARTGFGEKPGGATMPRQSRSTIKAEATDGLSHPHSSFRWSTPTPADKTRQEQWSVTAARGALARHRGMPIEFVSEEDVRDSSLGLAGWLAIAMRME